MAKWVIWKSQWLLWVLMIIGTCLSLGQCHLIIWNAIFFVPAVIDFEHFSAWWNFQTHRMHVAGYHDFIALGNQAGTSCNTTPDYIVHGTLVELVVLVFLQPVLQLSYQTFSSHFTFITVVLMLLIHISTPQCSQSTNAIVPFCCEYPPTHPDIFIVDVALSWCPCFGHHSVADSGWPHRGLIHTYIPISRRSTHTYSFGNVRFKQINSGSRDGSLLAICQPANVYTVLFFALFNCVKSFMCNIKYILHTLNNACLGIGGWSNSPISYPQFQWLLLWCAFNDLARRSLSHSTKRHTWFCCRILWTIESHPPSPFFSLGRRLE